VTIRQFGAGKFDVTRGEWSAFVVATKRNGNMRVVVRMFAVREWPWGATNGPADRRFRV